jgi:hypothetical protein
MNNEYEALQELILGHLSAHSRAQWESELVVKKLSSLLIKRIYKRFDVKFKEPVVPNPYGDDDYAVPVE